MARYSYDKDLLCLKKIEDWGLFFLKCSFAWQGPALLEKDGGLKTALSQAFF